MIYKVCGFCGIIYVVSCYSVNIDNKTSTLCNKVYNNFLLARVHYLEGKRVFVESYSHIASNTFLSSCTKYNQILAANPST